MPRERRRVNDLLDVAKCCIASFRNRDAERRKNLRRVVVVVLNFAASSFSSVSPVIHRFGLPHTNHLF